MKILHRYIVSAAALVLFSPVSQAVLTSAGDQMWHLDKSGVAGGPQDYDYFGSSVSAGDFNGDGYEDLAVGIPDDGLTSNGGRVSILYGSSGGLISSGSQIWKQGSDGINGSYEWGDDFGTALAAGDFDGDGYDDLAIGSPGENDDPLDVEYADNDIGMITILYGTANGLAPRISNSINPSDLKENLPGQQAYWVRFGFSLATGDINGDGYQDLVAGAPSKDLMLDPGVVAILFGSPSGLHSASNQILNHIDDIAPFGFTGNERYGYAVATGDVNGDAYDDVAVGVPGAAVFLEITLPDIPYAPDPDDIPISYAGLVHFFYGTESGADTNNTQMWNQNIEGIKGGAELGDEFGSSLAMADFDRDGYADLAVGVPLENVGALNAGMVNLIYGSSNGLAAAGNQTWHQDSEGIGGKCEGFDHFGSSLAAGDFSGDGYADLAVGVPGENIKSGDWWKLVDRVDCGMVNVLYGSAGGLTAANDQTWHQDSGGIAGGIEHGDMLGWALASGDFNGDMSDDLAIGVPEEDINNSPFDWDEGAVNVIYSSPGNRAPIADAGRDTNVVCEAGSSVMVVLNGTGSYDPDGHEITWYWEWAGGSATGETPEVELPLGTHTITLIVSDEQEDSEPDTVTVTVVDIAPPVFDSIMVSPSMLWPPNHKMVKVNVSMKVEDNCDPSPGIELDAVTMNEGESGDCDIVDTFNIMLRCERTGQAPQRIYTLHYIATDTSGNSATNTMDVIVPHDRRKEKNR